jgi:hypothetical protein
MSKVERRYDIKRDEAFREARHTDNSTDSIAPSLCDLFAESTDATDRDFQKAAAAAQRKRDAEQMEALREQLRKPITAGHFSELARGGHGPSSVINKFFSDGEAE